MDLSYLKDMRPFNINDGINLLKSGGMITMSWGVDNIDALYLGDEDDCRGLAFEVNGHHFKGTVVLTVNFMDYYEVRFLKDGVVQEDMTMEDVFVGDIIEQMDRVIEYIPEYENR
jgi:hypothetical protein